MKGPRGSLGTIYESASQIAQARLAAVGEYLDNIADTDDPPTGGVLSNIQYRALLANSKEFQEGVAERAPFMSEPERARLRKTVDELFPEELPASVSQIPPQPWEN